MGRQRMVLRKYRDKAIVCDGREYEVIRPTLEWPDADVRFSVGDAPHQHLSKFVKNLNFDSRILPGERRDHLRQHVTGDRRHARDDHAPTMQHGLVAHFDDAGFNLIQRPPGAYEKPLALHGQTHAARRAVKQRNSQNLFQAANMSAERRLGQVELLGCFAKASLGGDCREGPDLAERWIYHDP